MTTESYDFIRRLWTKRSIYEGWNMVEELDVAQYGAEPTLKRAYTWGLDLSGSFSGAGGIGGLLEIRNYADGLTGDAGTYLTVYDGNGNLTGLISNTTNGLVAEYVPSPSGATPRSLALYTEREARAYDPFGSMLRETGRPIAFEQPFRFATKTYDRETELCNFGFRHYHTSLGRFINRDPIEERGGWALFKGLNYGMLNPFYGNRSLNATNFLAEYGSRQDEGLKNTSLAHSTETIGTGQPKNSQAKWERDLNTKYYSANANATGHVGQGGSSGIEWHTPDRSVRSADPWNRDANLYIYAGNDPINSHDAFGLEGEAEPVENVEQEILSSEYANFEEVSQRAKSDPTSGNLGEYIRAWNRLAQEGLISPPGAQFPGPPDAEFRNVEPDPTKGEPITDDANVVRGGSKNPGGGSSPQGISGGTGVTTDAAGKVHGVSTQAGNKSVAELSQNIKNNQIGVTTAGDVRAAGGTVEPKPRFEGDTHAEVGNIEPDVLSNLLEQQKNPNR